MQYQNYTYTCNRNNYRKMILTFLRLCESARALVWKLILCQFLFVDGTNDKFPLLSFKINTGRNDLLSYSCLLIVITSGSPHLTKYSFQWSHLPTNHNCFFHHQNATFLSLSLLSFLPLLTWWTEMFYWYRWWTEAIIIFCCDTGKEN